MTSLALAENSIQLVPDGTLLIHVAIILVMVYVLDHTMFRPINKILAERERRSRAGSTESEDILKRVDELLNQYERSLHDARTEGYKSLEDLRAQAMQKREARLESSREEAIQLIENEKLLIKQQADTAKASIDRNAATVALSIGARILRRPI